MSGVDNDGLTSACPRQAKVASLEEVQLHSADDKGICGYLSGGGEAALTGNTTHNNRLVINSVV